ncbi:uncharacterized protein si:ch211-106e7.2 [Nerophis ophidion]|uniref:uncharacterized protein si:ch211-106e7.2 n=1 Tax=Nerophis ophidion TaxID=159077 RepID=UPI002ADF8EF9|nr:uncharacterized protein si:ch211-106e7.2 [Nerophis ophidion]XP_061776672.1 uncharacterized protein si:ch211-106e7.2 [Nerophis ophidion]XP_061776673.1 uncharacterized protein si:ch211-106e7.2 [Nerophis ophidion]XP_061776674.1 uncharacterized protein si:ch211-106e7.2 [Nerophis ophidion]
MQTCALMNEVSWQPSNRNRTHASNNNGYLYTHHSIGLSSLPSQDGRVYHNVSHDPQSGSHGHQLVPPREFQHSMGQDGRVYHNLSNNLQSGSLGHQFVPPREFQQSVGQNLSEWSRRVTSCSQSDAVAHSRQPTRLHSDCVVSDASQHRLAFYHNMATPSQYPDNSIANPPSSGQSLLNTNAHQKSEQCSLSTPVVSKQVMHPAAPCHNLITSVHGRTPQACPSLRRHQINVSQQSPPHPPQPFQNNIPETIQLQTSELDWSQTKRHHQYQIDHKLQAPEPLSSHCTDTELAPDTVQTAMQLLSQKYPLIFKMLSPTTRVPEKNQDRSSLPVCDLATKGCASSGQGSTGLSLEVSRHQKDSCSGDSLGQTDKKVPETHPENTEQKKRTLQSLASSAWTTSKLVALVQKFQQAKIMSDSSASFDINHLTDLFWNKDVQMLCHQIKSSWYTDLMTDILAFLTQHWTADSAVLTQAKCNLNVEGIRVLQDGEEYVEPHYVSSWRNVNEQLDDIDKEFGCAMTFDSSLPEPLVPTSAAPETANTSKVVEEQEHGEQEDAQEVKRIEDEEQRTSSVTVAHANEDDIYSFAIQVLPQEEAKAIYENSKLVRNPPSMQILPPKETKTIYENSQPAAEHLIIQVATPEEAKTIYENCQPVRDHPLIQDPPQEEATRIYKNSQPAVEHPVIHVLPPEEAKTIYENSQPVRDQSFIQVLPQEEAKTIYENSQPAGDHFVIQVLPQEEAKNIYENSQPAGQRSYIHVLPEKDKIIYENSQPAGQKSIIHVRPQEEAKTTYEKPQSVRDQHFIQNLLQEEAKTIYENSQPAEDHFVIQVLSQEEAKNIYENSQPTGQKSFNHVLPEEDKTIYENSESAGQPSSIHVPPQEEAKTICENFQPAGQKCLIHVLPEEDKTIYENSQSAGQPSSIHVPPQDEAQSIYVNFQPVRDHPVIQVVPQEETKTSYENSQSVKGHLFNNVLLQGDMTCINKYSLPVGDHPPKELLKGSKVAQVDSRADKDLPAESEVEVFFAQWKEDFLSSTPTRESKEDLSRTVLEDEEAVLDCASCTNGTNQSINPNHAKESSLFQNDDQETGNVPKRRADITSNAFCREEFLTLKRCQWCTEKRSNKSEMVLCFGTKRKRARHSAINVPVLKKLKTCKRRSDLRPARRKDSAKSVQPVELVLFGTAGRRPNWTRPMSAPEVLSVSRRGISAVKQRIYQEWSLPPTRIGSRSKLGNQKRPFTERRKSEDSRDKEKLLPEIMFRKDNNNLSRKKWRPRSDGQGIREKDWWRRSKDGQVRKSTEGHSNRFWNASKPANPSGRK